MGLVEVIDRGLDASWAQAGFQARLLSEVEAFKEDAAKFGADWEANGPMVPGLDPMAAEERLKKFQQLFEVELLHAMAWHPVTSCFNLPHCHAGQRSRLDVQKGMHPPFLRIYSVRSAQLACFT